MSLSLLWAAALALLALSLLVPTLRSLLLDEKKAQLRSVTEVISHIVAEYRDMAAKEQMDVESAQRAAIDRIRSSRYAAGVGYFFVTDIGKPFPSMILHPITPALEHQVLSDPKYNTAGGQNVFQKFVQVALADDQGFVEYLWPKPTANGLSSQQPKLSYVQLIKDWNWVLGTGVYIDELDSQLGQVTGAIFVALGALCIALLLLSFGIGRGLGKRLRVVVFEADQIGLGVLGSARAHDGARDEVGQLSASFERMAEQLRTKEAYLETLASKDLSVDAPLSSPDDRLGLALTTLTESFRELFVSFVEASDRVNVEADQLSVSSSTLSKQAADQSSSLEEMGAAVESLTQQSRRTSHDSLEVTRLTAENAQSASRGQEALERLVGAIRAVNVSAQKISQINKLVDDIAFQTNLLALNANVEAARAGKYGRGFSVVAQEVRSLANRTAVSAQESSEVIGGTLASLGEISTLAQAATSALGDIHSGVEAVRALAAGVSSASQNQSTSLEQVSEALAQIERTTLGLTNNSQEGEVASAELNAQARHLQHLIRQFQLPDR